jgi:hypothetical protein
VFSVVKNFGAYDPIFQIAFFCQPEYLSEGGWPNEVGRRRLVRTLG